MAEPWQVSVVIPARNEERNLPETIRCILENIPSERLSAVVVVDNGSSDDTVSVAQGLGAKVVLAPDASLGGLRNRGASAVEGPVIMFLDADVSLAHDWAEGLPELDRLLEEEPLVVTGSWCEAPSDAGWVARAWSPRAPKAGPVSHLGTAHLIVHAKGFEKIGRFNEALSSGEDFEFCGRARQLGGKIVAIPELRAIHRGEPSGLKEFFLREVWHGTGDVMTLRNAVRSYVAVAAAIFAVLHFTVLAGLLIGSPLSKTLALASGALLLSLVVGSAVRKQASLSLVPLARTSLLVWVYLWARTVSLLSLPFPSLKGSPRSG